MSFVDVGAALLATFTACWLGLYLLARDFRNPLVWSSGGGLLAFAFSLAAMTLRDVSAEPLPFWTSLHQSTLLLPLLFWLGTLIFMLPENHAWREPLAGAWRVLIVPAALVLAASTPWLLRTDGAWMPAAIPLLFLFGGIGLVLNGALVKTWREHPAGIPRWLVPTATLFYFLGLSLTLFPILPVPNVWLNVALAGDLLLLGISVAALNAFAEGETVRFDMLRSFSGILVATFVLGGQVVLVMVVSTGLTAPMLGLLLTVCATLIAFQQLEPYLARLLDRLLLPRSDLAAARSTLRETAAALPRGQKMDAAGMDEKTFDRATRKALSKLGNLPRLAANPLTQLPQIEERLAEQLESGPLARAAALQALLTERIEQLKPAGEDEFGTTSAWRHYNALYFPYVVGLRPYRRRPTPHPETLSSSERVALTWFRDEVPERTLYNWQNDASRLIARDLQAEARQKRSEWH